MQTDIVREVDSRFDLCVRFIEIVSFGFLFMCDAPCAIVHCAMQNKMNSTQLNESMRAINYSD